MEGRGYPVEVRYRPLEGEGEEDGGQRTITDFGHRRRPRRDHAGEGIGDTLVFLPGEREIREAHQALERRNRHTEVLPLYARLSAKDQDRVFQPGPQRRIVLATNVAETSPTVPRIHYAVDPAWPGSSATARGRSWTGCTSSGVAGQRQPARRPLRAHRAGHLLPPLFEADFARARRSPILRSVAPRWRA